jgi:hypothetical protein
MVFALGLRHTFQLCQRGLGLVQFSLFRHRSLRLGRCRKTLPLVATDYSYGKLDIELAESKLERR